MVQPRSFMNTTCPLIASSPADQTSSSLMERCQFTCLSHLDFADWYLTEESVPNLAQDWVTTITSSDGDMTQRGPQCTSSCKPPFAWEGTLPVLLQQLCQKKPQNARTRVYFADVQTPDVSRLRHVVGLFALVSIKGAIWIPCLGKCGFQGQATTSSARIAGQHRPGFMFAGVFWEMCQSSLDLCG